MFSYTNCVEIHKGTIDWLTDWLRSVIHLQEIEVNQNYEGPISSRKGNKKMCEGIEGLYCSNAIYVAVIYYCYSGLFPMSSTVTNDLTVYNHRSFFHIAHFVCSQVNTNDTREVRVGWINRALLGAMRSMLTAADFVRHAFPLITHHINKQQNRSLGTSIIHAWPRLSHLCNKAKYITPFLSNSGLNDRHMH